MLQQSASVWDDMRRVRPHPRWLTGSVFACVLPLRTENRSTFPEPHGPARFLSAQSGVNPYGPPLPLGPQLVSRTGPSKYNVGLVIVDRSEPGSGPVMKLFTNALGPPKVSSGQFSLWANLAQGDPLG